MHAITFLLRLNLLHLLNKSGHNYLMQQHLCIERFTVYYTYLRDTKLFGNFGFLAISPQSLTKWMLLFCLLIVGCIAEVIVV